MLRHVDLCSGIGGFALGFEWAELSRPVLFCDIEPWSRKVLRKHWPDVPIAKDVKELANDPNGLIPECDILTAGYPCQPFSLAGERRGTEDDRHIWPYIFSIIQAKRPSWCVFENVYGHVTLGLDEVLSDLEGEGYAARPFIVPACATDAPHRRDRVWIIARNVANTEILHSNVSTKHSQQDQRQEPQPRDSSSANIVADPNSPGLQGSEKARDTQGSGQRRKEQLAGRSEVRTMADPNGQRGRSRDAKWQDAETAGQSSGGKRNHPRGMETWNPEPPVGRVAHGIPRRVDRLRGLGNAIVPQIAQRIGETIKNSI